MIEAIKNAKTKKIVENVLKHQLDIFEQKMNLPNHIRRVSGKDLDDIKGIYSLLTNDKWSYKGRWTEMSLIANTPTNLESSRFIQILSAALQELEKPTPPAVVAHTRPSPSR